MKMIFHSANLLLHLNCYYCAILPSFASFFKVIVVKQRAYSSHREIAHNRCCCYCFLPPGEKDSWEEHTNHFLALHYEKWNSTPTEWIMCKRSAFTKYIYILFSSLSCRSHQKDQNTSVCVCNSVLDFEKLIFLLLYVASAPLVYNIPWYSFSIHSCLASPRSYFGNSKSWIIFRPTASLLILHMKIICSVAAVLIALICTLMQSHYS